MIPQLTHEEFWQGVVVGLITAAVIAVVVEMFR